MRILFGLALLIIGIAGASMPSGRPAGPEPAHWWLWLFFVLMAIAGVALVTA